MEITLTPNGEGLLRAALARHPDQSSTEIVEQALAESVEREAAIDPSFRLAAQSKKLPPEEFDNWIEAFTKFSDKIPSMPAETFSREMIYQDPE
jgi:predicted transcriptional regulator